MERLLIPNAFFAKEKKKKKKKSVSFVWISTKWSRFQFPLSKKTHLRSKKPLVPALGPYYRLICDQLPTSPRQFQTGCYVLGLILIPLLHLRITSLHGSRSINETTG